MDQGIFVIIFTAEKPVKLIVSGYKNIIIYE